MKNRDLSRIEYYSFFQFIYSAAHQISNFTTFSCCVGFSFLVSISFAQSSFGGYSNVINWNQINTDQVRVIFPDSLEEKAQRVANIIHYMNDENVGLLGTKRKKVDIILRGRDVISNGYAQIAPLKSEFFIQAPQKTFEESSVNWIDQLAIHEYRHINQFVNAKRGIGNLVYWIFGDYGWGGLIGLTTPAWFIEGDATINETALSSGGRGRIPSFSSVQRAQQQAGVDYSYMKALNGSYKDLVPNHYAAGYLILSEIRREHGNESFNEITRQASNFKGIFYPFRKAVKRVTGTKIKQHYLNATEKLEASIPEISSDSKVLTELEKNNVVTFDFPILDDGEIYFFYGDRRDIGGIYKYKVNGDHERIVYMGLALDRYFDKHENLFVWNELQRDIRRGNQNYSNLVLYDSETKAKRIIGRGEAYFSPSFSNDGKNLIFVNGYSGSNSGIMMMNIKSNALLEIIKSDTRQFLYPIASEDGKSIYTNVKEGHKYAIAEVDLDGTFNLLTDWDEVVFGPIKLSSGHLVFQANYGTTDQVFALELESGALKTISNDPIGVYNPSNVQDGRLIASRPHAQGFLLHEIKVDLNQAEVSQKRTRMTLPYYLQTDHLEPNNILDKVPANEFKVTEYPRNVKIVRPHSWLLNTDGTEFSATLFSDNILNNLSVQPSYRYNSNVKGSFVDFDINYGRWFPIFQLGFTASLPRTIISTEGDISFTASQQAFRTGFVLPFNLTRGINVTTFQFSTYVDQIFTQIQEQQTLEMFNQQGTTLGNVATFIHRRLTAIQNYYPWWGYVGQFRNRYRFNDGHLTFNLANDFYVRGFHPNHGFKFEVDLAVQNESAEDRLSHVDVFNYAHGFRSVDFDRIWSFNTNYGLPVAYPDWGFADFIYFKRINSVLFHNYNSVMFDNNRSELQSVGVDLLFDVVFNNTVFSEITVGFRNAYMIGELPDGKTVPYHFEFIVDIPAF